jgi:hypothetical protein
MNTPRWWIVPAFGGVVIGALLALSVVVQQVGVRLPTVTAPCFVDVEFIVVELPGTPVLDMTQPLPPVPGAVVEVAELGITIKADSTGKASIRLPLSEQCRPRVYTFVVTTKSSPHQSVFRRIFHVPGGQGLQMFFDPNRDLYIDSSFKEPPKTVVTIIVTDRRGVFPVAGASVRIPELDLVGKTDEHGEAELIVPLGGPWTFEVAAPGEERTTKFKTQVPDRGSSRFVIRIGGNASTK